MLLDCSLRPFTYIPVAYLSMMHANINKMDVSIKRSETGALSMRKTGNIRRY